MSALPSTTTFDDYLNEQLINCLNLQTNVIQNLAQYSQHISLQLFEIKNNVNILTNRVLTLQQQQECYIPIYPPPPPNPLLFYQLSPTLIRPQVEWPTDPVPFAFSTTTLNEQPSRNAPFVFGPINSNNVTHLDGDEPPISFDPIVHLSPVEVKTGEEDENILFCERAKLYRFDFSSNQMKERGTGEMKILQHKTTNHCRVLMRREQVFKVCANHKITSQLELIPHQGSENAYVWSVVDFADGAGKHETFCVKFKTDEQAKQFSRIFNESKRSTGDLPLIGRISLNDDDVIPIGEVTPTIEQIERARKLQLPSTFYLYENKIPCKGCRGCQEDSSLNEIQLLNQINPNFPSGFFPNSTPPSLMSMAPMWSSDGVDSLSSPQKDHRMIIKAKRALPNNRAPPPPMPTYEQTSSEISRGNDARVTQMNQKKSRNFSGYNPETQSFDNYASKVAENILDQAKQELGKQISEETNRTSSTSSNSGFSFTNFQLSPNPTFTFVNTPEISFADLVKKSLPKTDETEEPEANTTDDPYEPTISYKPIVQLSPVEVKTGEEDENILFCERAKLYRFDPSINQMKERGIGEMKILQHKTTNNCRVLMRREHIFKICANHKITSQLELKPHQGSENAYIWSVMDFSDGHPKHETLCVKFKTSDIAKRFFQQFNDAKIVK